MNPLFLSWQQPANRWWPVGRVSRDGADFVFSYTEGANTAAAAGFRPLSGFPEFDQVYRSSTLFPILQNRLPPRSRPDYGDFVDWLDLPRDERDPLVLLARSGGQRETDRFEVFSAPDPQSDGRYRSTFFLQGLRYGSPEAKNEVAELEAGDELALEAEPGNPGERARNPDPGSRQRSSPRFRAALSLHRPARVDRLAGRQGPNEALEPSARPPSVQGALRFGRAMATGVCALGGAGVPRHRGGSAGRPRIGGALPDDFEAGHLHSGVSAHER